MPLPIRVVEGSEVVFPTAEEVQERISLRFRMQTAGAILAGWALDCMERDENDQLVTKTQPDHEHFSNRRLRQALSDIALVQDDSVEYYERFLGGLPFEHEELGLVQISIADQLLSREQAAQQLA